MPARSDTGPEPFQVLPAAALSRCQPHMRWLVEGLWSQGGVGLLASLPKLGKSWLGLDLAVSVASATACLGHFQVPRAGAVLVYMAEDAEHVVQQRLLGLCRHRNIELQGLPLFFISEPRIRLDHRGDRERLIETVQRVAPRLLVLDPLVRMHGADENDAGAVSSLLAHLREMQRRFELAIVLIHHVRKSGASAAHIGLSLRGSGDFHAWGDHNLYLRRARKRLELWLEHRAAPSPAEPFHLALVGQDDDTHLELQQEAAQDDNASLEPPPRPSPQTRVLTALGQYREPVSLRELRGQTRMRTQTLCQVLSELTEAGRVSKNDLGYQLANPDQAAFPFPVSADHRDRGKRDNGNSRARREPPCHS